MPIHVVETRSIGTALFDDKMPFSIRQTGRSTTDIPAKLPAKLFGPSRHGLVRNDDTALGQQIFDHPPAQGKTEKQPDRMSDHIGREAVAVVQMGARHAAMSNVA